MPVPRETKEVEIVNGTRASIISVMPLGTCACREETGGL